MSLIDLLTDEDEERSRTKRINGIVTGIVTNNRDEEGLGRIKVNFPWLSEENETDWAKVMSFMGGKERGGFFLPEVGDEVLVAFEQGDINYPYVIGALWNNEDKPPEINSDGKNNIRKIRSRSGHEIIFNDDDNSKQEKIEIHTNGGHKILLDDSAGQEKIEIIDKTGSNKMTIDSVQNSISIESSTQIKIKSQVIEIEAGATMTIKAGAVLNIQGALVKIN
ncbi:MAG: hypothetical protein JJV91_00145 [Desulfosarcina sp.]|nr:hypothetical protein [Desulfobacterales bacterium]